MTQILRLIFSLQHVDDWIEFDEFHLVVLKMNWINTCFNAFFHCIICILVLFGGGTKFGSFVYFEIFT